MTQNIAPLGIIGLGTMGRNLALNLADHGVPLVAWERDGALADRARSELPDGTIWATEAADLARRLAAPRAVLLMVTAGAAVDAVIDGLRPHLQAGDVIIDGGNTDAADTARRQKNLAADGIHLIGLGVSGGEEGARRGPALMAGGDPAAWDRIAPMLRSIAARAADGTPCCERMGGGAAGHFVKTVHNGIEYAVMQALAESYDLMRHGLGLEMAAIGETFATWNRGPGGGYLVEIAADVVRTRDSDGAPLLDKVVDRAGQKGTGRWASLAALDLGVAAPSIAEAVFARAVSAARDDRQALAADTPDRVQIAPTDLEAAMRAATLLSFLQGFALIAAADARDGWAVDPVAVAKVWRAGCILRAPLLDRLADAFASLAPGAHPLSAASLRAELAEILPGLRRTAAAAIGAGYAVPALTSALSWHDGMVRARVPADFLQGLRDRFGAHTFERTDAPGSHHADWSGS
ncbi:MULTISPECIES: NADP-dependent phosphogluconate dehydrogenase [Thalassobaculum]|uniref:6-phosphogluconate dehydrogenase, decarboxylating n=1 Tax=Thalassobaculum litoreum DSM 18839 TaxID=1123362 RepID=A0A8G2EWY5_9PROT|nr:MULTISPECIES: NADP-dependent phosphogluconate dehydrogenase [Thalassobaculum]SDF16968.1 6-phosphogluconate dehydrogenase [Thalassobaculum litoreum DSM 18839]